MKCNRKVFYYLTTSKSRKIFGWVSPDQNVDETLAYWKANVYQNIDEKYEICDGDVEGEIAAEDAPYFGGTSAELNVRFRCKKCGCNSFPELPNQYNINEWLNKILQGME